MFRKFKYKNKKAFTFVEMLLASAMIGIVSIAVYNVLSNGLRVWEVVHQETPQIDINLFFSKMEIDLKNSVHFSGVTFIGSAENIEFPSIIQAEPGQRKAGKVRYAYEPSVKAVSRQQYDYPQIVGSDSPIPRIMIAKIYEFSFKYYFYDQKRKNFFWTSDWPPTKEMAEEQVFPQAVRVSMIWESEGIVENRIKTIEIPHGGMRKPR